MSDQHRTETPGGYGDEAREASPKPVPRDMPDQQAGADGDPWELEDEDPAVNERPDPEIPDTDETGTGRRGAPHSGSPNPEHPVPDEPTA